MIRFLAFVLLLLSLSPAFAEKLSSGGSPDTPAHAEATGTENSAGAFGMAGAGDLTYPSTNHCPAILVRQPQRRNSQTAYDRDVIIRVGLGWKYRQKGPYAALVIGREGSLSSIKILKSAGKWLDAEAKKLAQSLDYPIPSSEITTDHVCVKVHFNKLDL